MSRSEKWTIALGILGIVGVGLQVWLAVIGNREHKTDIVNTLCVIALWLVVGAANAYAIFRNWRDTSRCKTLSEAYEAKKKKIAALIVDREDAAGKAYVFWFFANYARDLTSTLEQAWHHWHAAGEALVHPAGGDHGLKKLDVGLLNERRDFMVLYAYHLTRLQVDLPDFSSQLTQYGYPSETEYPTVLSALKEHARLLDIAGNEILESSDKGPQ